MPSSREPNVLVEYLTCLIRIREVQGSSLGLETGCRE
jgi:hypothetical protein